MIFENTVDTLGRSLIGVGGGAAQFIPNIFVAVIVFALGFLFANIIGRLIEELAHSLKIDAALSKTGLRDSLKKAGISLNAGAFIGGIVQWIIVLAFLIAALSVLGLTQVTVFLTSVLGYIPQVLSAGIIIIATAVLADFLKKIVSSSARVADFGGAELAGSVVKLTVWVFGAIIALQELGIPTELFQTVITGIVAALSLAFGLAFGLGGRDVAAKIVAKKYEDLQK